MLTHPLKLGVNIDHVATLRQVRRAAYPDPLYAALVAEQSGADSITLHLREDRRHIQDHDVVRMRESLQTRMNLEMAATEAMLRFAREVRPQDVCLVPERREELTTEGGLDVAGQLDRLRDCCAGLEDAGVRVSLFVDPEPEQLEASLEAGAPRSFQPMNVNFGLFPPLDEAPKGEGGKRLRGAEKTLAKKKAMAARALAHMALWLDTPAAAA